MNLTQPGRLARTGEYSSDSNNVATSIKLTMASDKNTSEFGRIDRPAENEKIEAGSVFDIQWMVTANVTEYDNVTIYLDQGPDEHNFTRYGAIKSEHGSLSASAHCPELQY